MVSNKLLSNRPITTHDITNETFMLGPILECVRGKTARNKPSRVETEEYVKIPEYFYKLHKFVNLTSDVMFVNEYVFMMK